MPSNKPATTTPPAALPDGIEIFRAGRHLDDAGVAHHFSEADLDGMAASYSPALREAPLTVGHPKDNLPAYGWVKAVARTAAGALAITPHQVEPQFAEMVQAGRFKKRSASFYPPHAPNNPTPGKWYLRHVAFLGAQPPAVAGLKDIEFSEGDQAGAVNFSETVTTTQEPDDMSKTLQEQLEAAQAQLAAEKTARERAEADAAKHKAAATEAQEKATSFAEKARTDAGAKALAAQGQFLAAAAAQKSADTSASSIANRPGSESQFAWTRLAIMDWLKQAGLDEETAKKISGEFVDSSGNVPYINNGGQIKYAGKNSTMTQALHKAAEQHIFANKQDDSTSAPTPPSGGGGSGGSGGSTYTNNVTINGVGDWGVVRGTTRHTDAQSAQTEIDLLRQLAQAKGASI